MAVGRVDPDALPEGYQGILDRIGHPVEHLDFVTTFRQPQELGRRHGVGQAPWHVADHTHGARAGIDPLNEVDLGAVGPFGSSRLPTDDPDARADGGDSGVANALGQLPRTTEMTSVVGGDDVMDEGPPVEPPDDERGPRRAFTQLALPPGRALVRARFLAGAPGGRQCLSVL